mmetsp:Transcript_17400/g.39390  ORF Transcript_17400/g.39390 Transcript_17400/m.39390 type:complete len:249 (+) Transcript_17400:103-849(+)
MAGCGLRALVQIFLTVLTLTTGITAFTFAWVFEQFLEQLHQNFQGELTSQILPCIRSTLKECDISNTDKCWTYCCPPASGYFCFRSPVVGLMCQDSTSACGDPNWCRDYADVPKTCVTEVCKTHQMVKRVTKWSYFLAAGGIVLDLLDIIVLLMVKDAVVFKSAVNICSSLAKWLAFGTVVGAGTVEFMSELIQSKCYNNPGMDRVTDASSMLISYIVVQVISAVCSMCLAPCSAFYGGRLTGVPNVK